MLRRRGGGAQREQPPREVTTARFRAASSRDHDVRRTLLVVGLIAGWLAGLVMKGSGYGLVGDILVGILGAVAAALLFVFIVPANERTGFVGTIVVALIGAAVFVGAARLLTRRAVRV